MSYTIVIDRTVCSGFGACVEADPDTFEVAPDGIASAPSSDGDRDALLRAARSCPMGAIAILDESGRSIA